MKTFKFILFFILYFIFNICINVVHPITTDYVDALNLPTFYFGLLFSLMSLGQVIGALFFGFLSDKIGRKWLIAIGAVGYCLAQLGFGYINKWPWLILIFRVLSGIFVSAPNTLFISMCLDYSCEKTSVRNLMILSSFNLLGASVGYEIGGSLYTYLNLSFQNIFLIQALIGFVTAIIFVILFNDKKKETSSNVSNKFSFKNFYHLDKLVYVLLIGLFVLTVGQILINKYLDSFIIHNHYEAATLGHYVLITGIASAISNLILIPIIKRVKNKRLAILLTSFIGISAGLTFITFLLDVNILYLLFSSHLIYIILKGLIMPLEQNELATYSNGENNGQLMGARQTVLSIGNVVGPLLGLAIYQKGSPLIFIIAACIIIASLFIYITYFAIKDKKSKDRL